MNDRSARSCCVRPAVSRWVFSQSSWVIFIANSHVTNAWSPATRHRSRSREPRLVRSPPGRRMGPPLPDAAGPTRARPCCPGRSAPLVRPYLLTREKRERRVETRRQRARCRALWLALHDGAGRPCSSTAWRWPRGRPCQADRRAGSRAHRPVGRGCGRLLPWTTPEGKPCYVMGGGTDTSTVSPRPSGASSSTWPPSCSPTQPTCWRTDNHVSSAQLCSLGDRMTEALRDVVRIAHSRGARLPAPEREEGRPGTSAEVSPSADRSKPPGGRTAAIRYVCTPVHRSLSRAPGAPPSCRAEWISRGRTGKGAGSW